MNKEVRIGQRFHSWRVISIDKNKSGGYYICRCVNCGLEKSIRKYSLIGNKYALCPKCGLESIVEANINTILKHWNIDLNGHADLELLKSNPRKSYWFICSNGHNYRKTIREFLDSECPSCKKQRQLSSLNSPEKKFSFAGCYPHLLKFYSPKNNDDPFKIHPYKSIKNYLFTCSRGHNFQISTSEISTGKWCPKCEKELYILKIASYFKQRFSHLKPDINNGVINIVEHKIIIDFRINASKRLVPIEIISKKDDEFKHYRIILTRNLQKDVDTIEKFMLELNPNQVIF